MNGNRSILKDQYSQWTLNFNLQSSKPYQFSTECREHYETVNFAKSLRVITNASKLNNTRSLDHFKSYFILHHKHRFGNKRGIERLILGHKMDYSYSGREVGFILGEKFGLFWKTSWNYSEKQDGLFWETRMDESGKKGWIIMWDKFRLLRELTSSLGSNQDRANCFTHKKALLLLTKIVWDSLEVQLVWMRLIGTSKKRAKILTSHWELPLKVSSLFKFSFL